MPSVQSRKKRESRLFTKIGIGQALSRKQSRVLKVAKTASGKFPQYGITVKNRHSAMMLKSGVRPSFISKVSGPLPYEVATERYTRKGMHSGFTSYHRTVRGAVKAATQHFGSVVRQASRTTKKVSRTRKPTKANSAAFAPFAKGQKFVTSGRVMHQSMIGKTVKVKASRVRAKSGKITMRKAHTMKVGKHSDRAMHGSRRRR